MLAETFLGDPMDETWCSIAAWNSDSYDREVTDSCRSNTGRLGKPRGLETSDSKGEEEEDFDLGKRVRENLDSGFFVGVAAVVYSAVRDSAAEAVLAAFAGSGLAAAVEVGR